MATYWHVGDADDTWGYVADDGVAPYVFYSKSNGWKPFPHPRKRSLRMSLPAEFKTATFTKSPYAPGEYHKRMWRGDDDAPPTDHHAWASAFDGVDNLLTGMRDVFRTVEPVRANMKTYGHEIRQLVVLACNEVEAQFKSVLRDNHYVKPGGGYETMGDYFKASAPMRLPEWRVKLTRYPREGWIRPFRYWTTKKAFRDPKTKRTHQLPWYAAYNATKHDREVEFAKGNLGNLIEALAGAVILVTAQFGQFGRGLAFLADFNSHYETPTFGPSEFYIPPAVGSAGVSWHHVDFKF